jgi:hypothetical protein
MTNIKKCFNLWKGNLRKKIGEGSSARNSSARKNCSTPKSWLLNTVQADAKKNETAQKNPKKSFRADAIFRPKWSTAQIATARQKHWKISTAQI